MTDSEDHDDLSRIEERLRRSRAELSPIELDEVKRRTLARASTGGTRMKLRSKAVTALLVLGLVGSGSGAVLAASGGNGNGNSNGNGNGADRSQYCPPSSPGGGKAKHPGSAKCGHPGP